MMSILVFAISDNRNSSYTGPRVLSDVTQQNVGPGKENELKPFRFSILSACLISGVAPIVVNQSQGRLTR